MRPGYGSIRLASLLILLTGLVASRPAATEPTRTRTQIQSVWQHVPLYFEANRGQTDRAVQFLARGQDYSLFLTPREAVLVLRKAEGKKAKPTTDHRRQATQTAPVATHASVLRMRLLGANSHPKASGQEKLPGQVNYFIGNNPKKWRANVPTYQKVHYKGVYPGIDLVYYGNQQQLEYDFVVRPGADPKQIALAFAGAKQSRIDTSGELVLKTNGGEVRWHRPVVYQEINGQRKSIAARYALMPSTIKRSGPARVSFRVARYDRTKPLVIDPILAYSTYLGGNSDDIGAGIAVDTAGYVYVTGSTSSTDYPTRNAYQGTQSNTNVFVTKIDPTKSGASSLLYSTYLGGSSDDGGGSIALDGAGYVYVAGGTNSSDFPVKNACQTQYKGGSDVFVTKLDMTKSGAASLLYSTYLGGSSDDGGSIKIDAAGYVYVAGGTNSTDFPTRNAYQTQYKGDADIFVTRLDTRLSGAASLLYSTYLGGGSTYPAGWADDIGYGFAVDGAGCVYMAGVTNCNDFPTRNAYQSNYRGGLADAFVFKLDTTRSGAASLLYSTFLGGPVGDFAYGITVDGAGYIYVTGSSDSSYFPIKNGYPNQYNRGAFVTKLDPRQSGAASLLYSTFLGGNNDSFIFDIAVDGAGYVYIGGQTNSTDFPTRNAYQESRQGVEYDAFVVKLDITQSGAAQLLYSTYLGGNAYEAGTRIAVDEAGCVYVRGWTQSLDFPTWNPYQGYYDQLGYSNTFLVKLDTTQSGAASLLYSTFLGRAGAGIVVDGAGNVYATGGANFLSDFPTRNAFQNSFQGGDWDAFVVKFAPDVPYATVSGTITLEDCVNPAQPVTFTLRPTDGAPSFSHTLTLNADGTFTLANLARKNYQLAIKGSKWLQKVVSVNASNGNVTNVSALLPAGDAINDNIVDVEDLAAFIQAFDADPNAPNWNNGRADFDCNSIVDVEDLSLLIRNFDREGDP